MKYIVTKYASVCTKQRWKIEDSLDGVVYSSFEEAAKACKKLGGIGVAELSE